MACNDNIIACSANIGTSGQRSSWSAFSRSTGKDISGHYKRHSFIFFLYPFLFGSLSSTFLIEGELRSKTLFCKSERLRPKLQTPSTILLGPPSGHFRFCRRCVIAGSEQVASATLSVFQSNSKNYYSLFSYR